MELNLLHVERHSCIPTEVGYIYILYDGEEVVYVGQSKRSPHARIVAHHSDKKFDAYSVLEIEKGYDLLRTESYYIVMNEPIYNKGLSSSPYFYLTVVEAFDLFLQLVNVNNGYDMSRIGRQRKIFEKTLSELCDVKTIKDTSYVLDMQFYSSIDDIAKLMIESPENSWAENVCFEIASILPFQINRSFRNKIIEDLNNGIDVGQVYRSVWERILSLEWHDSPKLKIFEDICPITTLKRVPVLYGKNPLSDEEILIESAIFYPERPIVQIPNYLTVKFMNMAFVDVGNTISIDYFETLEYIFNNDLWIKRWLCKEQQFCDERYYVETKTVYSRASRIKNMLEILDISRQQGRKRQGIALGNDGEGKQEIEGCLNL